MPREDHRRRFALVLSIFALVALLAHQNDQSRRITDLEEAKERLELSRMASKLDSAESRDSLRDRIARLEAEIERLPWERPGSVAEAPPPGLENPPESPPATGDLSNPERIDELLTELASIREQQDAVREVATVSASTASDEPLTFLHLENWTQGGTTPRSNPDAPSWSEAQAKGPPDTDGLGDLPTAWASKRPNEGVEWLEVDFPPGIVPSAIVIVESHNPGAVTRVEGGARGSLQTLWSGTDPATEDANEFVISVSGGLPLDTVRLILDTRLVAGWNEIDAVGLEVGDEVTWGIDARASSSYADR